MSLRQRPSSTKQETSPPPPAQPHEEEEKTRVEEEEKPIAPVPSPSVPQKVFASTANLANLLPTGTLMAFQVLTPVFTNNGTCDAVTTTLTHLLLLVLAATSFLACLTDSFRAADGQLYYGFATPKGMWLFEYPTEAAGATLPDLSKYRLRLVDFVHGFLSAAVFGVVALRDKNVRGCLYPMSGHEVEEVLDIVPLGVGVFCSMLFVVFPTTRHGIGFPVTTAGTH